MASVNKVILLGNLGRDPEVRYTADGAAIANLAIATTETWKDKASGERKEATEWHRVVLFGRQAELAGEYLRKGRSVYIEGRLQTRKWQDKEGVERYTTEIRADVMQFVGGAREGGGMGGGASDFETAEPAPRAPRAAAPQRSAPAPQRPAANIADMDDDIPF